MLQTSQSVNLGPATVVSVEGATIRVLHDGKEVEALNALAFPYQPRRGDVVLLISQDSGCFVIGVLQATGDVNLTFPANVHFHAPKGNVQFTSGTGIEMQAPEVKVTAGAWTVLAKTLTEKVTNAFRWVKDLASLRAGRQRNLVEGASYERAERRVIKAKKDVRVNGNRIHLG
jgi:hypothetical protein